MHNKMRLFALVIVTALIGACATTPPAEPEPVMEDTNSMTSGSETQGLTDEGLLDPTNYADRENLNNPDSLLSKRTLYFDYDSSRVRPEFMEIVRAHATYISSNPNVRVRLEGHADERGTREYNLGLGERRSRSVMDMMVARGASRGQADTISYGEERPVRTCSSESCWSENRRVEIVYSN